jgi:hypothetical protein
LKVTETLEIMIMIKDYEKLFKAIQRGKAEGASVGSSCRCRLVVARHISGDSIKKVKPWFPNIGSKRLGLSLSGELLSIVTFDTIVTIVNTH